MIGLIQRVSRARVEVDGETVGAIGRGVLALVAVERADTPKLAERLVERILSYRIFEDDAGKMNRSLLDIGGELLLVSQFTLAADTNAGTRASFTPAAPPELGRALFDHAVSVASSASSRVRVATGRFGAHMQVSLTNDGPVTFWLTAR